jgi:hypothetical protein
MNSYKNKTVLVTGASSGIGLAMAHELSNRGANVILTARSTEKLNMVAENIHKNGKNAYVFSQDLSVPAAAEKLYSNIHAAGLEVDILINNAGYGRWGDFTEHDRNDYSTMIQLNIIALTELCHLFIPDMITKGKGGIINVGSTASFVPVPYSSVYASSKGYVLLLTEALRYEYADKGLRIMAVCPGATDSNFRSVASEKSKTLQAVAKKRAESGDVGDTCEDVAIEGLDAFLKNKMYVITGKSNKRMYTVTRFLSRERVLKMVGGIFQKMMGK